MRPVEARPERGENDRQQCDRDHDADERDEHAADADAAQERHRQHGQRQEADGHGGAAEDDRAAGGRDRTLDRLLARVPMRALLAPADDDEQRVVDRDAEPDERDQEADDAGDRHEAREAPDEQEARHDRAEPDDERHEGEQRGEHEGEHEQRANPAQHSLGEDAEAALLAARRVERVEAAYVHRPAGKAHPAQSSRNRFRGGRVLTEATRLRRRVGKDECRPPVRGDERATRGRCVRRNPRLRHGTTHGGVHSLERGAHGRRLHGFVPLQRDNGDDRGAVATVAEASSDRRIGLVAFTARHRVLVAERVERLAGGEDADRGQPEPKEHHELAMPEREACETDEHAGHRTVAKVLSETLQGRNLTVLPRGEADPPAGGLSARKPRLPSYSETLVIAPTRIVHLRRLTHSALLRDVLAALVAYGLTLAVLHGMPGGKRHLDLLGGVLAGVACFPLLTRRRWPLGVFVLTTAASAAMNGLGYGLGPPFGPTFALFFVAIDERTRTRIRQTAPVVLLMFAIHVGSTRISHSGFPTSPVLFGILVWGAAWVVGDQLRHRRHRRAELVERAERERRLAVAEERTRIARDLHDSAAHAINVILVQAGAARLLQQDQPAATHEALTTIED